MWNVYMLSLSSYVPHLIPPSLPLSSYSQMMAAAKPLSGRSLYIQNGADKICYDVFYGTRKPAVMYLPCLFYPKVRMKEEKQERRQRGGGRDERREGRKGARGNRKVGRK